MKDIKESGQEFGKLVRILDRLRGEEGCPWDREQDEKSIINYFLEEVYEAIDAIDSGDAEAVVEELGDVLMEVVFLARIFKEKQKFTIYDVLKKINQKMIQRHPHVFGLKHIKSSAKVLQQWERLKRTEKGKEFLFDDMIKSLPALLEAFQIGVSVSAYGFDWNNPLNVLQKVKEEVTELEMALKENKHEKVAEEMGDLFFSMANLSRHLGVNPEIALKQANKKFINRFNYIEKKLKEDGKELTRASLKEMDEIWEQAKNKVL